MLKKFLFTSLFLILLIPNLKADSCTLQSLTVSHGTLSPAFASEITQYTVNVSYSLPTITVSFHASQNDAIVTVNGLTVTGGQGAVPINLPNEVTIIMLVIKPADGSATTTYNITVRKKGYLTALTLQTGTGNLPISPEFLTKTFSYTASVETDIPWVRITPTTNQGVITVNGIIVTNGTPSGEIALSPGNNIITIEVISTDGSMSETYTIDVYKPGYLTSLTLQSGTVNIPISPVFSDAIFSYTANVAPDIASVTVTPTTDQGMIKVNGIPVSNGQPSGAISLSPGSNIIIVEVNSTDGSMKEIYTINVNRARSAYLSMLFLRSGRASIPLTPAFSKTTFNYSANINYSPSVAVMPTAEDTNSTIKVNGIDVPSGQMSSVFPVTIGVNTITVQLISADGSEQLIYTIIVTVEG